MQTKNKIISLEESLDFVRSFREQGQKVVFTNGCYDLLHPGHVDYLEKASAFGDKLVVAVNSDRSIKKLKGDSRPIIPEDGRNQMIASLEFTDLVVPFSDETPIKIIEAILPDVLVKGSDYKNQNIVGSDIVIKNGGRVELVDLLEGYSTTTTISKIENLNK